LLGAMPSPDQLGPLGAYLVSEASGWCSGKIVFTGGSEIAVVAEPRLLEVVRSGDAASLPHVLETVTAGALAAAESGQATNGGSNARFPGVFDEPAGELPPAAVSSCAVVSDRPDLAAAITAALEARKVTCTAITAGDIAGDFAGAAGALEHAVGRAGSIDAVVVATASDTARSGAHGWERTLSEHEGIVEQIHADAAWARAVADLAARTNQPVRLVTLTDAVTAGGRSRAQAAAQLARAARRATDDLVSAFAVSVEAPESSAARSAGELAAHLASSADAAALSGAELVAADGWFGLRSHPHPGGSITYGGPELPHWFDGALRSLVGAPSEEAP
jgi:hypothetical protein